MDDIALKLGKAMLDNGPVTASTVKRLLTEARAETRLHQDAEKMRRLIRDLAFASLLPDSMVERAFWTKALEVTKFRCERWITGDGDGI